VALMICFRRRVGVLRRRYTMKLPNLTEEARAAPANRRAVDPRLILGSKADKLKTLPAPKKQIKTRSK
jgi:hypothetical protein